MTNFELVFSALCVGIGMSLMIYGGVSIFSKVLDRRKAALEKEIQKQKRRQYRLISSVIAQELMAEMNRYGFQTMEIGSAEELKNPDLEARLIEMSIRGPVEEKKRRFYESITETYNHNLITLSEYQEICRKLDESTVFAAIKLACEIRDGKNVQKK